MLEQFLTTNAFAFLLIFTRIGSGVLALPGFGESYVPQRIRLLFAVMLSLLLLPVVAGGMPPEPASPYMLAALVAGEAMVGLLIGGISRILVSTMHVAGTIISFQSGLSSATMFDINQASQGSMVGNLLSLTAVILIFSLDLHHLMLSGLTESYGLFPVGRFPPMEDFANLASSMMSRSFMVAVKLTAPFLVIGIIMNLAAGVLSRLMPNMQIFFVLMPPQIVLSFFLLTVTLSALMLGFTSFFDTTLNGFLEGR